MTVQLGVQMMATHTTVCIACKYAVSYGFHQCNTRCNQYYVSVVGKGYFTDNVTWKLKCIANMN